MTLPPQIQLRARCADAADLSDIIFKMQITAGSKNPYHILFPKTARNGSTTLSASDVEGQFRDHWEMGLMDYNGTLADANDVVTIRLFDVASVQRQREQLLAWPLLAHEKTRWRSREQFVDDLLSCRNEQFMFDAISTQLPPSGILYLPIRPATVTTNAI